MSDGDDRHERWAIFWCTLLSPLLYGEIPPQETGAFLRALAEKEHLFPDGQRRKPARSTLWRKWQQYRQGGFEALLGRRRKDLGNSRKDRAAMIAKAVVLKKDQPRRSDHTINKFLEEEFQRSIPKSTLYRHLKQAGATRLKLGISQRKVRCRWTRDKSNDLWLGDFEDGPYVIEGDRAVETHLSAFIDCHSRFIVEARYYLKENLDILCDSLLRGWSIHGASREVYLDNAKIYHAHALQRACLALNIRLLHRPVRDPPPGGLIECFFKTAQSQFEAEVRAGEILTLDQLNRALAAWLEVSYHERPNSDTGEPPRLRYERDRELVRHVNVQEILKHFLKRERRTVDLDYSDVRLNGSFFRVDLDLRGDKVEVRYDPFGEPQSVLIYSPAGEYLGVGTWHDRSEAEQPPPAPAPGKPQYNYLDLLVQKHQRIIDRQSSGIDYLEVMARADRRWPFLEFAKRLAALLGKSGGLSAFCAKELESLQKVYNRLVHLDAVMLEEACARVRHRTIPEIVFVLQQLHDERSR